MFTWFSWQVYYRECLISDLAGRRQYIRKSKLPYGQPSTPSLLLQYPAPEDDQTVTDDKLHVIRVYTKAVSMLNLAKYEDLKFQCQYCISHIHVIYREAIEMSSNYRVENNKG